MLALVGARLVTHCTGTQTSSSRQQHRGQIGLEGREYGVKNTVFSGGLKKGNWHGNGGMCRRKMMINEQTYSLGCHVSQEESSHTTSSGGQRAARSNASATHEP